MPPKTVAAAKARVRTLKKQTTKKGKLLIHSRAKLRSAKKTLRRLIKREKATRNPQGGRVKRRSRRRRRRRRRSRRRRGGNGKQFTWATYQPLQEGDVDLSDVKIDNPFGPQY